MIRILLIDDQKPVLQSLERIIELEGKLKVVGTAENGQQGIKLVEQLKPDVAIIDLTMPLLGGIETTYFIAQNHPQTKVIIFTGSDGQMLNRAILAGARGYLLKNSSIEDLFAAIYAVNRDSVYIGKGILDRVQLSSVDSQRLKIKQINLWLAKEVLDWWCEHSVLATPTVKQVVESLSLNQSGLSWMKGYLCQQKDIDLTLTEEIELKVDGLFVGIKDSVDFNRQLIENKSLIFDWLDGKGNNHYSTILQNNFQLLQGNTLEKLQKIISTLWQQAAPLPLLNYLQSVEKYLSNRQQFLKQEYENNKVKENAARQSFDYLLSSPDNLLNKRELCKKAVLFTYQCKINAELNNLLAQIILTTIEQLKTHIDILAKTNNFLSESKKYLEQKNTPDAVSFTPFFEQLQKKVSLEELRRDLEKSTGHFLNQWGVCESISNSAISNCLIQKLRPIVQQIYSDLRKEALAISFLEYAESSNYKSMIRDEK
jgi:DNA-binding NarL/FixJ family response regulator